MAWLFGVSLDPFAATVHIINTETRNRDAATTGHLVRDACQRLRRLQIRPAYLKVDSTLRGEVPAALHAVQAAAAGSRIWLAPSFPDQGRIVVDGELVVHGQPQCNVRALFEQDNIVVFDAATDRDLFDIASRALECRPRPLLAGSAGLARQYASLLAQQDRRPTALPEPATGPAVLLAGTIHQATLRQLSQWRYPRFSLIEPLDAIVSSIRQGADTLVEYDWSPAQTKALEAFCRLLPSLRPRALMLTGGDTASLVCLLLEAVGIRLADEILPGVPWGRLMGGASDNLVVVTKSGGFGPPDALETIRQSLPRL